MIYFAAMKTQKMNILKKLWCRVFQGAFRLALPILPYRDPTILKSINDIPKLLKDKKKTSILIVTDPGVIKCGLIEPILEVLNKAAIKYTVYSDVQPNPTVDNVENARLVYINEKANAIIAIGGGSAMDTAKALGARIAHPRKSLKQMGGILRVYRSLPTFIAIPTTAGTGSETTLAAIITEPKTHHKYALMSFPLIPHYAVLDPRMTVTLPAHLTATTGLDALTHAIEAFIGRSTTRETRQLAIDAVKLIFANIENAYKNGSDLKARENMLIASFKAGLAFSKSYVGYVHAVAHSLGGKYNTPHGLANAVLLTHVLEEYGKIVYTKLATLAKATNICSEDDTPGFAAEKFIKAIKALNENLGIPKRIESIVPTDIPELARHAEKEANPLYPVPKLMTAKELEKIYHLVK